LFAEFQSHSEGVNCISWNPSSGKMQIVVGSSNSECKIWEYNDQFRKFVNIVNLKHQSEIIRDVCWAPNLGRSYHLIATASGDQKGQVKIFKLVFGKEIKSENQFSYDTNSEVWRVEWNVTGTTLAASGDDGCIQLFRKDFEGKWKLDTNIKGKD